MSHECATTLYPTDIAKVTDKYIKLDLEKGRHVTVGANGWVLDVWDPKTKKLYDNRGNEIGTRDVPFSLPEKTEAKRTGYITIDADNQDKIPDEAWVANAIYPGWFGEWFEGMPDAEFTFDAEGKIVEVYEPSSKWIYDIDMNHIGTRAWSFPITHEVRGEYKDPLWMTYSPEDVDRYDEGSDAWEALNAGYTITIGPGGYIVDIWHPTTKKIVDVFGGVVGTREDPFPSDNNIDNLKEQYTKLLRLIAEQRILARRAKGEARAKANETVQWLLRKYGQLVFQYGRLLRSRRRMSPEFHHHWKKESKSTTPQMPILT